MILFPFISFRSALRNRHQNISTGFFILSWKDSFVGKSSVSQLQAFKNPKSSVKLHSKEHMCCSAHKNNFVLFLEIFSISMKVLITHAQWHWIWRVRNNFHTIKCQKHQLTTVFLWLKVVRSSLVNRELVWMVSFF